VLTTSVERLEGTTVKLTVTVEASDVDRAIAETYSEAGKKLRIPGFRKGKAPRPVVDNYVGQQYVLTEATEALVNKWYPLGIDAEGLRPIESPELDALDVVVKGEPYTFVVEVQTRPVLELESYEGIKVEVPRRAVNDADIDKQIEELRERFASLEPVEGRGVAENDYVLISFTGYVNGETYEGNQVDKYLYEMGKGLMPAEFDEALLGQEGGTECRIEFVIPDTSSNTEYVGKNAEFDVIVHEVKAKKLPEVDDAFAAEMGFDTVDAMRTDLRSRLDVQRLFAYNRAKEKRSREELAHRLPGEIPAPMIRGRMQSLETDFNQRLKDQGLTLEQYASMTGLTRETFEGELSKDAEQQVREDLALEALFRALGYEVTDAELDAEFEDLASSGKTTVEEVREKWQNMGLSAVIAESVMHRRAVGWLMENVETVEVEGAVESEAEGPFGMPGEAVMAESADEPVSETSAAADGTVAAIDEPAPAVDSTQPAEEPAVAADESADES
jgi:trigger factor